MSHTPFPQAFLDEMKATLFKEKEKLEAELSAIAKKGDTPGNFDASYPEYGNEEDDNVKEIEEFTVNKPLEIALENSLRDVNKALKRLSDGVYGICKYCDKQIDEKRLRARPTSSACVSCKKLLTDEA